MPNSVEKVIAAIGGTNAAARLLGVKPPAVSNWKALGAIPANWWEILSGEFERRGLELDPKAFGFRREAAE